MFTLTCKWKYRSTTEKLNPSLPAAMGAHAFLAVLLLPLLLLVADADPSPEGPLAASANSASTVLSTHSIKRFPMTYVRVRACVCIWEAGATRR